MTEDEFVTWVSLHAPSLRSLLDALEEDWGEAPPQTEVALFVIIPGFIDALRRRDAVATSEIAELLEKMCTHADEDLPTNIVLTIAPHLAGKLAPHELTETLGRCMALEVAPYLSTHDNRPPSTQRFPRG